MAKQKRQGGWAKRDRWAIALRVSPRVAKWYADRSAEAGRSRNNLLELWLEALPEVMDEFTEYAEIERGRGEGRGRSGSAIVEFFGERFVRKVAHLGLSSKELHAALFEKGVFGG
ncbi:MAG: hypothetical protein ABSF29_06940 [Tepidisphaeraceae bacterium]|jgi:hypothetical protein